MVSHEGERQLDVAIDGEQIAALYEPGTDVAGGGDDRRHGPSGDSRRGRSARALRDGLPGPARDRGTRELRGGGVRRRHHGRRLRDHGAAPVPARHDQAQEGAPPGQHRRRLGTARDPYRRVLVRERRGDRRRDPQRDPDDQDDDDLRLDVRRRPPLRRDVGDRRARRHERRPRRGRRDRELADRQVRARGQDPRGLHLRGPRTAGGGGGHAAGAVPRRARRLAAVHPAHGGRVGDRGAGRVPRPGTADVRRDAGRLPELHPGRPVGRDPDRGQRQGVRPRRALQQLPHAEVRPRPGHVLGGDHRRPASGGRDRPLPGQAQRPLRGDGHDRRRDAGRPGVGRAAGAAGVLARRGHRPLQRLAVGRAGVLQPGPPDGVVAGQGRAGVRAPMPTSSCSTPTASGRSTGRTCT